MRLCLSDYPSLYRELTMLNRNAGALLKIDRDADPAGCRGWQLTNNLWLIRNMK